MGTREYQHKVHLLIVLLGTVQYLFLKDLPEVF